MAHTFTHIEGFECVDVTKWRPQGWSSGGGIGTAGAGNQRTGATAAFAIFQGWCQIPLRYAATGLPAIWPVDSTAACVMRCYYRPVFIGPANPVAILTLGRNPIAPVYRARVELDAARELSLNGVKSGAPTVLAIGGPWYRLELKYVSGIPGQLELLVDGAVEVSLTPNLLSIDFAQIGDERPAASGAHTWDDLLIESHRTNPAVVDYPGPGEVHRLLGTANGTDNNWRLGAGANKWAAVNEVNPDGVGSFLDCNNPPVGVDPDQTLEMQTIAAIGGLPGGYEVRALQLYSVTRRTVNNPDWHYARIRSGLTVAETPASTITCTPNFEHHGGYLWQDDPNTGAPWTQAAIDSVECGLGVDDQANVGQWTTLFAYIEAGPPFPTGRAKLRPISLGPPGLDMMTAPTLG